jgi:hypothetical protein
MSMEKDTNYLSLGDIIKITSNKSTLNNNIYYIDYIDEFSLTLVNSFSIENIEIRNNKLLDNSITKIEILSKNKINSYVQLNNLNINTKIEIIFDDYTITGYIKNIIEDMIEIQIEPNNEIIYIDFEYKGIPKDLNIKYINIVDDETDDETDDEIDEDLQPIQIQQQIDDKQKRYTLKEQNEDMINNMINLIKFEKRNKKTVDNIKNQVDRFNYLRKNYSVFNNDGISIEIKYNDPKPLIDSIKSNGHKYNWIIPITNVKRKCDFNSQKNNYTTYVDYNEILKNDMLNQTMLYQNSNEIQQIKEIRNVFLNYLNDSFQPYSHIDYYLNSITVNDNVLALINENGNYNQQMFVSNINNYFINNNVNEIFEYFKSEKLNIINFLTLPYPFIYFSNLKLNTSNIFEKSLYSKIPLLLTDILSRNDFDIKNTNNYSYDKYFESINIHNSNLDDYNEYLSIIIPDNDIIVKNIIEHLKIKNDFFTLYDIYNNLQFFNIDINKVNFETYKIIQNECIENYKNLIERKNNNMKILNKYKPNKIRNVYVKSSFDYLYENNIDDDINVKNQIDFFIKYFKSKISSYEKITINEINNFIKNYDVYRLYDKIIKLKNIFNSKINYKKLSQNINTYNEEIDQELDIDLILEESLKDYELNIMNQLKIIEKYFDMDKSNINKTNKIKNKINNRNISLLENVVINENESSPYETLRDEIINNPNKFERNNNILLFIHQYCRRCSYVEKKENYNNQFWFYCRETNYKLLPTFYYDIAVSVIEYPFDTVYQNKVIETICKKQGVHEKGKIIDIHTSFTIQRASFKVGYEQQKDPDELDYEEEDGWNDVGGVNYIDDEENDDNNDDANDDTNDADNINDDNLYEDYDIEFFILEKDEELKLKDFEDFEPTSYSFNIVNKIINLLGIHIDSKNIENIVSTALYTFDIQNKKILFDLNNTTDLKRILQYKIFLNLYNIATLFIHIQMLEYKNVYININTNAIKLNVFENIKVGFPLFDENNYKGIELFSKLIKQLNREIKDKGFTECIQLDREKQDQVNYFLKNLVKVLKKNILPNKRVKFEIDNFKKSLDIKEDKQKSIKQKYTHLLPPLIKQPYLQDKNVTEPLPTDLLENIFNTSNIFKISNNINILNSKNIYCSYGIIEIINSIINNENTLIKNYLENSCCISNKGKINNIINYLNNHIIHKYISTVNTNESILFNIENVKYIESKYNNLSLNKYKPAETVEPYLNLSIDDINLIIDPNSDIVLDINVLYEKLKLYYESKKYTKLDFSDKSYDFYTQYDDNIDDSDKRLQDMFIDVLNNKNDINNEFEKYLFKINNSLENKIKNKIKLSNSFLNPVFTSNNIFNMKKHIQKYIYVPLSEKINNKNILNLSNSNQIKLKEGNILNSWGLSKKDAVKLANYIISENSYKDYENDYYNQSVTQLFINVITYYKNKRDFIDNLQFNEYIDEKKILLYLRYFYLKMIYMCFDNNIDSNSEAQIKDFFKKCESYYDKSYNTTNIQVEQVNKGVIISKEDEKDNMTNMFKRMSKQQITVSYELRQNKLGQYGIGLKKGFQKYSKKFEDNN